MTQGSLTSGKILVVEPEHLIAQVLSEQGYQVLRLHYHECIKSQGREVPRKIRDGEITGICVAYHEWKLKVPTEAIAKFHKELLTWIKHAHDMHIDVYILGLTGTHWNQSIWDQLISTDVLFESKHRFCALDMKLREMTEPSNLCLKILSTTGHSSNTCDCGIPFKDHVNDWRPKSGDYNRMNHRDGMLKLYRLLDLKNP